MWHTFSIFKLNFFNETKLLCTCGSYPNFFWQNESVGETERERERKRRQNKVLFGKMKVLVRQREKGGERGERVKFSC